MRSIRYNITDQAYNDFTRFCLELKQQNNIDVSQQECMIYLLSTLPKIPSFKPDPLLKAGIEAVDNTDMWKKLGEDQRRVLKLISLGMLPASAGDKKLIATIKTKV